MNTSKSAIADVAITEFTGFRPGGDSGDHGVPESEFASKNLCHIFVDS